MSVELTIDGKKVTAQAGENLIDVARRNGAAIPSLCHHKLIEPYGACRLCLVEVTKNGRKKITTSCNYEVHENITVCTENQTINKHRKMVLELLLAMAPDAEEVQKLAANFGVKKHRFAKGNSPADRENCIVCGLCTRVCETVVKASAITLTGRGDKKGVEVPFKMQNTDDCIGCGACAFVCPTGAIEMERISVDVLKKRPGNSKPCRYALMKMMPGALCPNNYDCASCEVDQKFTEQCRPHHPIFAARGLHVPRGWEE